MLAEAAGKAAHAHQDVVQLGLLVGPALHQQLLIPAAQLAAKHSRLAIRQCMHDLEGEIGEQGFRLVAMMVIAHGGVEGVNALGQGT